MTFDDAFERLLGHEGGYANHRLDPGGATMWGITEKVARESNYNGPMEAMPQYVARAIYRQRYWDAIRAEDLPAVVRYAMFDAAVNSGVMQATLWLQRAACVHADGVLGPMTIAAAHQMDVSMLRMRLLSQRLRFMAGLPQWTAFGRGWARRIADLMEA